MAKQRSSKGKGRQRPATARLLAIEVLQQLLQDGRSLSDTLSVAQQRLDEAKDQALLQEFCFGVARWFGRLDAIAAQLLQKKLKRKDFDIQLLILLGLYQLIYMRLADHAAVSQTAESARTIGKSWAVGLINGVLRNFQRRDTELLKQADATQSARLSSPEWLLQMVQQSWPERWPQLLDAANQRPPMTLRINERHLSREAYLQQLQQQAIEAEPVAELPAAVVLKRPRPVLALPGFAEGDFSVQDAGAQLAATLLDLKPGLRLLDACAAPGGKSCHILELVSDIDLTAMDIDARRLERVQENLQRLKLNATLVTGDAAKPEGDWAVQCYDRILLDVPCSATGVIRRHPDIKWLRREEDIAQLAQLQSQILNAIWPLLKPGGLLLYATCSLLPDENELQVGRFLARTADATARPIQATWGHAKSVGRQTLPGEATMDGFYYALLEKR
ncbi:MAG: 16S rRNA (cytosine(967)-C(5))-methyltransferase RsmB [Candidatus Polarisedimenticolaceae bacterium]|nr:16S rRNA (cytosine(967)-C(5))-methyltransferase RsmB [Candidatus Polarisedimenticolaceae bacterium]